MHLTDLSDKSLSTTHRRPQPQRPRRQRCSVLNVGSRPSQSTHLALILRVARGGYLIELPGRQAPAALHIHHPCATPAKRASRHGAARQPRPRRGHSEAGPSTESPAAEAFIGGPEPGVARGGGIQRRARARSGRTGPAKNAARKSPPAATPPTGSAWAMSASSDLRRQTMRQSEKSGQLGSRSTVSSAKWLSTCGQRSHSSTPPPPTVLPTVPPTVGQATLG
jgi:hypothetical protein